MSTDNNRKRFDDFFRAATDSLEPYDYQRRNVLRRQRSLAISQDAS